MIIKQLEVREITLRNTTVNGLNFKAILNGLADAGSQHVDFSKTIIKVILTRNDVQHVIMQDNLKLLGLAATLNTLNQYAFGADINTSVKLAATQSMVSFFLPFGGHIRLTGDDKLYIEVQNLDNLFQHADLVNNSYIEVKECKSVGYERFIPQVRSYIIQANEQSNQYNIGDNVIRLAFLNYDKTGFTNSVISNLVFTSDRLSDTWTFQDLVAKKISQYREQLIAAGTTDLAANMQQDQSFVICDWHQEFDAVMLDMNFNSQNVNASKNMIVAWTYDTNWTILNDAEALQAKHQQKTVDKISTAATKK